MKFKNIILGSMLTVALACGAAAAFPTVSSAVALSNAAAQKMNEQVFVKTQNLKYTSDRGQKFNVAVSSNSDDSSMLMYFDFFGDSQRALVQRGEDGKYVVKEGAFFGTDAVKVAKIASENGQWREM
jgi:hypothetical protein